MRWLLLLILTACGGRTIEPVQDDPISGGRTIKERDANVGDEPDVLVPPPFKGECSPDDISGFTPNAVKPPRHVFACTQQELDDYWASCLDKTSATATKCTSFGADHVTCGSCVVSYSTDAIWGPLVKTKGVISANVAGCVALQTGDTSPGGCAYNLQAQDDCAREACIKVCPPTDDASLPEFLACVLEAKANVCKTFTTSKQAACAADASPSAQICLSPVDFKGYYDLYAPMFCSAGG